MKVLLAIAFALPAAETLADEDPYGKPKKERAIVELEQGNRFYKLGNFQRAIDFYTSGATLESAPVFYFNLAQCHRQLGHYKKAIWFFGRWKSARDLPSEHALVKMVNGLIRKMQDELSQRARTQPPTEPGPEAKAGKSSPHAPAPTESRPVITTSVSTTKPWYSDRVGWGLAGSGAVVGGIGVGLLVSAAALRSDAEREIDVEARDLLRARADTRQTWGIVLGVTGAAALLAGALKLRRTPASKSKRTERAELHFRFNSVVLQGRFR